jgi:hypothetical protein
MTGVMSVVVTAVMSVVMSVVISGAVSRVCREHIGPTTHTGI